MLSGVFAHDHFIGVKPNGFGFHDLIGHGVFENPVLVNARFVGKGIGPHNRFVWLHHHAGDHADHAADLIDAGGLDACCDLGKGGTGI